MNANSLLLELSQLSPVSLNSNSLHPNSRTLNSNLQSLNSNFEFKPPQESPNSTSGRRRVPPTTLCDRRSPADSDGVPQRGVQTLQPKSLLQGATKISVAGCNRNLCRRVQPKSLLQGATKISVAKRGVQTRQQIPLAVPPKRRERSVPHSLPAPAARRRRLSHRVRFHGLFWNP